MMLTLKQKSRFNLLGTPRIKVTFFVAKLLCDEYLHIALIIIKSRRDNLN